MKFPIGTRVRVYCHGASDYGADFVETSQIWTGTVKGVCGAPGMILIHPDGEQPGVRARAHEKSCRRLVKKERRRVYIYEDSIPPSDNTTGWSGTLYGTQPGGAVEFVEVRRERK